MEMHNEWYCYKLALNIFILLYVSHVFNFFDVLLVTPFLHFAWCCVLLKGTQFISIYECKKTSEILRRNYGVFAPIYLQIDQGICMWVIVNYWSVRSLTGFLCFKTILKDTTLGFFRHVGKYRQPERETSKW